VADAVIPGTVRYCFKDCIVRCSYSLKIASIATLLTLLVGYPIAYAMTRAPNEWRVTLVMLVILPFWTSFLIRVYAWIGILSNEGFLNQFLMWSGLISEPLVILNTNIAVYIGIVYTYLPFLVLPVYSTLEKLDETLLEAAEDLGCLLSGFYTGSRGVCNSVATGWVRYVDDRQGAVGGIFLQP